FAEAARQRDQGVGRVAVVTDSDGPLWTVIRPLRRDQAPVPRRVDAAFGQNEFPHEFEVEALLIDRTVAVIPRVFGPGVGAIRTREARISPSCAALTRQKGGK